MKSLQIILAEITKLTTYIESNYPELYVVLDENPLTIPSGSHPKITLNIMNDYLESLKQMLKQYIKNRKL